MARIVIKNVCPQCQGDGWFGETQGSAGQGPHPCTWGGCAGTGYVELGFLEMDPSPTDLQDKHQDILDKLDDIIELLSP